MKRIFLNTNFVILLLGLFFCSFLSFLKFNGSSVGMYAKYINGSEYSDPNLIFGVPRYIRSDEWLTMTPQYVSQYRTNFFYKNILLGDGQVMNSISDIPAYHWKNIFYPLNWVLLYIDFEFGYSFKWWLKGFLLFFALFLFLKKVSRSTPLSFFVSIAFLFSPFIQWWYSTGYPETIGYFILILLSLIKFLESKKLVNELFYIFIFGYFSLCFLMMLYPPFIFSMFWLGFFVFMSYVIVYLQNRSHKIFRKSFIFILTMVLVLLIFYIYYIDFEIIFNIFSSTSYPGKRVSYGGSMKLFDYFTGPFGIQLLSDAKTVPNILGNQCEAASFIFFAPIVFLSFLATLIGYIRRGVAICISKVDWFIFFVAIYLFISILWMFIGLPNWLSKIMFLSYVPEKRMLVGLGVADLFLVIRYFLSKNKHGFWFSFIVSFLYGLIIMYISFYFRNAYSVFLGNIFKGVFISVCIFLLSFFLLRKNKIFFSVLFAIFSLLSSYSVNPVYRGLGEIESGDLSKLILGVNKKYNFDNKMAWTTYDNNVFGQFLLAQGVRTYSAVYSYPQINLWSKLDHNGKYFNIYNRFAHVYFERSDESGELFSLKQPDMFSVKIDPCDSRMKDLNVKFFLMLRKKMDSDYCLEFVDELHTKVSDFYVYMVRN